MEMVQLLVESLMWEEETASWRSVFHLQRLMILTFPHLFPFFFVLFFFGVPVQAIGHPVSSKYTMLYVF